MASSGYDYSKVLDCVKKVLSENFIMDPPVLVEDLAPRYGLNVFVTDFGKFLDIAGIINLKTKSIHVNKNDSPQRQVFTVAHELGHWLMHKDDVLKNPDEYAVMTRAPLGKANPDPLEREANFFAANLLVPKDMLEKYKEEPVMRISKIFGVSVDVIGFRLKQEGYAD